jgi:hypothetical protein
MTKAMMRTPLQGNARHLRRPRIVADRMQQTPEIGAVHEPEQADPDHDEHDQRDRQELDERNALDIDATEKAERIRQIAAWRPARPHEGRTVQRDHHAERGDQRGHPQIADNEAIDDADREPDGIHDRDHPPGRVGIVVEKHGGADHRQRDHRAGREIETARDDDVDLPGSKDRQRRGALQEIHVAGGLDEIRVRQRDGDKQRCKHEEDRIDFRQAAAPCDVRRLCDGFLDHATILFERTA